MSPNGTLSADEEREIVSRCKVASAHAEWQICEGQVRVECVFSSQSGSLEGEFFMSEKLWISNTVTMLPRSKRVAYVGVVTAFTVVANALFEFKLADVQFSLTILFSALSGLILGAVPGFLACFLGDLLGFILHPFGAYSPWVGISTGLIAVIAYYAVTFLPLRFRGGLQVRLLIVSLLVFIVCTVGINTTFFYLVYAKDVAYGTYLITRLFVQGQIWNTLVNTVLLFLAVPAIIRIKPLRLQIH